MVDTGFDYKLCAHNHYNKLLLLKTGIGIKGNFLNTMAYLSESNNEHHMKLQNTKNIPLQGIRHGMQVIHY